MQLNLFEFENIKRCNACKKVLKTSEFYLKRDKRAKRNNLRAECKKCCYIKSRIYKEKNIGKWRLYAKNYELKNKHKNKEKSKQWYQDNRERKLQQNEKWKKNNYEKYKEIQRDLRRKRLKNDPLFKLSCNLRNRIWQAFNDKGYKKHSKSENILGTDSNTLKKHIENQFTDDMSWDNFDKIHIDHKIPIAAASTEFEVTALNHYTNLQPMWAEDNIRKSDKYNPEDFKKYMDWYKINIFKTIYLNK